ncbi:MAG: patatin-like phospholipase family protein [Anaerolineaceae bacterium]
MADISVALGGGGIKGIAHIGVLHRLIKEGFEIRAIAGTSAGGIIGSAFAAGLSPDEIMELVTNIDQVKFFMRSTHDGPSLLGLNGLTNILLESIGQKRFEDLPIPFACTAVDINSDQEVILSKGPVLDAIMATVAIPGIFPPVVLGDKTLVDGGVLDPVPVAVARWLAPTLPVVAVVLSPVPEGWAHLPDITIPNPSGFAAAFINQFSKLRIAQAVRIFTRATDITARSMTELRLAVDKPEIVIRPDVSRFGLLDFGDPKELIELGEAAADLLIPEIKQSFSWPAQISRRFRHVEAPAKIISSDGMDAAESVE